MLSGARPQIDDVVGGTDCFLVVLDNDHRVPKVTEPEQRGQELAIVALVKSDRRFVQHVQHTRQARAYLRGEANPLPLPA